METPDWMKARPPWTPERAKKRRIWKREALRYEKLAEQPKLGKRMRAFYLRQAAGYRSDLARELVYARDALIHDDP